MTTDLDDNAIDETPTLTGREEEDAYLERLGERRRKARESHDAVQAIIDANRARRNH